MTNSLFPNAARPETKNYVLIKAIKQTMMDNNLQPSDSAVSKIVQLYEVKNFRNSVILIGRSGAAKSTTWKILRDTMARLKREQVDTFETVYVSYITQYVFNNNHSHYVHFKLSDFNQINR